MNGKIEKERIIYDNYDLWNEEAVNEARENISEWQEIDLEEITDEMIMEELYFVDGLYYEDILGELRGLFDNHTLLVFGNIGRWDGVYHGFNVYDDIDKALSAMLEDCTFCKFYDLNGHFFVKCSHHDGTNNFEVKLLTDAGKDYLDRWEYSWNDKRKRSDVLNQLVKRYSRLPRYAEKVNGCPSREWVPKTTETALQAFKNRAVSNYC